MSKSVVIFDEPEIEFRYKQRLKHPCDGLSLFGPVDTDHASHPASLPYMLLGTKEGTAKFRVWSTLMNYPATDAPKGKVRLWPPFPGFEAAFCSAWPTEPTRTYDEIDKDKLLEASRRRDPYERAYKVVEYYLEGLRRIQKYDEKIGVAICVVPDEVWTNCRPESYVVNATGQRIPSKELTARKAGQMGLFDEARTDQYLMSPDFRRQLKARAMEFDAPIQIIRESTLRPSDDNPFGERRLTPLSDRMWNIGTALYYKCGGKPWRLVTARDGVCYIGIAFRRTGDGNTACCAAQMFLDTGDGVVFLGEFGPWYSTREQFHLSRTAARDLLQGVLKTYADLGGKALTEIFLHSRSTINDEEFAGYQAACPSGVGLVGVRVRKDRYGPRLFRIGEMPVLRGTFWRLSDTSGLLWGSGFKARLATYDGWETPAALRIDIQHGDAPIERVAQDILGLTKLNYNASKLGDSEPVTVGFSDAVGEILIANQTVAVRKPQFRFYI